MHENEDIRAAGNIEAAGEAQTAGPPIAPAAYWEDRYATSDRVWSGNANRVLADVAATLPPGRALDLGCGEGADVIWLALRGWTATGIDISPTAIRRATDAARAARLEPDRARFVVGDLAAIPAGPYELVTASFLHSPVDLSRRAILRQAAERVSAGGHLLITSHAAFPSGAGNSPQHEHRLLSAAEEIEQLALDPGEWEVVVAEARRRRVTAPDGSSTLPDDVVVLVRRR